MSKSLYCMLAASTLIFCSTGCDVEQTREGELPDIDVDVNAEPGQLPGFDVDAPDVDVSTEEEEVLVPKVVLEEETVTVPDVDVDLPKDE